MANGRRVLGLMTRDVDDWAEASFTGADAEAVEALQAANAANRNFAQRFRRDPRKRGADPAGTAVERIVAGDVEGGQVIEAVLGRGDVFPAQGPQIARRVMAAGDAGDAALVRDATLRRILFGAEESETFSVKKAAQRIDRALRGKNSQTVNEILGDEEKQILAQLRELAKRLVFNGELVHDPGTGREIMRRATNDAMNLLRLGGAGAAVTGEPTAAAGLIAASAVPAIRRATQTRTALAPPTLPGPPLTAPGAALGRGLLE